MRLEETGSRGLGKADDVLAELAELAVNEIQLSEPTVYRSTTLEQAAEALFRRFVWIPRRPQVRGRYLTRATLRKMIQGILAEWAAAKGLAIESNTEVEGALAPHKVDVVVRRDGEPDLIVLALPLRSHTATLIRDSLPSAVADMRASLPKTTFLAVLPDNGEDQPLKTPANLDTDTTRRFLSASVKGLTVLGVSTLPEYLRTYSPSPRASAAEQGKLLQPTR